MSYESSLLIKFLVVIKELIEIIIKQKWMNLDLLNMNTSIFQFVYWLLKLGSNFGSSNNGVFYISFSRWCAICHRWFASLCIATSGLVANTLKFWIRSRFWSSNARNFVIGQTAANSKPPTSDFFITTNQYRGLQAHRSRATTFMCRIGRTTRVLQLFASRRVWT